MWYFLDSGPIPLHMEAMSNTIVMSKQKHSSPSNPIKIMKLTMRRAKEAVRPIVPKFSTYRDLFPILTQRKKSLDSVWVNGKGKVTDMKMISREQAGHGPAPVSLPLLSYSSTVFIPSFSLLMATNKGVSMMPLTYQIYFFFLCRIPLACCYGLNICHIKILTLRWWC